MAKKTQPKISDLIEVLLHEMKELKTSIDDRNRTLVSSVSKIQNLKVDFDFKKFEALQKSNCGKSIKNHTEVQKLNDNLLQKIENSYYKKMLYMIILNIILLCTTGLSLYLLGSNSGHNSLLYGSEEERGDLKKQITRLNNYFEQNPEATVHFRKWQSGQNRK